MGSQLVNAAPASLYPLIVVVLAALFLAAVSVVGYLLKDLKASFERAQKRQDDDIGKVADDLSALKASLPLTYVLRDDFIRAVSTLDRKIDLIARDVADIAVATGARKHTEGVDAE
jgi:hypothetical protein